METTNLLAEQMSIGDKKPGLLNILKCKCPRCRRGDMFMEKNPYKLKTTMKMNEPCPVCGQPFDIEVGFYYGSSLISYVFSVALCVASLIIYWLTVGISLNDNRFFYWLIVNSILLVGLQPLLMRVARAVWLAFFVYYDKDWRINPATKPERTNEDQKNNW